MPRSDANTPGRVSRPAKGSMNDSSDSRSVTRPVAASARARARRSAGESGDLSPSCANLATAVLASSDNGASTATKRKSPAHSGCLPSFSAASPRANRSKTSRWCAPRALPSPASPRSASFSACSASPASSHACEALANDCASPRASSNLAASAAGPAASSTCPRSSPTCGASTGRDCSRPANSGSALGA